MSARDIIALCVRHLPLHPSDCSGFVRAVANDCGVLLTGDANTIVSQLRRSGRGLPDGQTARRFASKGDLVIAGAQAPGHGHVVVVVDGPINMGRYPYAFWGQYRGVTLNGVTYNMGLTRGHGTVNWAFGKDSRDSLVYAAFSPASLLLPRAAPSEGYLLQTFT
jgi:hypothetical protein